MYGTQKFNFDGASGFVISEIAQHPRNGPPSWTALPAVGTWGMFSIAFSLFPMWRGQIENVIDTFGLIGSIFTGSGHGDFLLASCQSGNVPDLSV